MRSGTGTPPGEEGDGVKRMYLVGSGYGFVGREVVLPLTALVETEVATGGR